MSTIYDFTYTLNTGETQNEIFYNSTITTAKTEYGPTSHFFVDENLLSNILATNYASDTFGPCGTETNNVTTKFRTTSKVRASTTTPVKVFAIANGQVLIQPQTDDDTKVNLILKPSDTYAPLKIKYFIYRGINKADLIGNNILKPVVNNDEKQPIFLQKLWNQYISFNTSLKDPSTGENFPPPTEFPCSLIGYDETQSGNIFIENYFTKKEATISYQIPLCKAGEHLGNFTGEIGLDIVLDYGDYQLQNQEELFKLDLKFAREKEHIFDIANIPSPINNTKIKRYKEYIHQFMDAAAFWGSHIDCGIIKTSSNSTGLKTNNEIFNKIVSKYQTLNNIYVYVQGENNRSYNYYDATRMIYGLSPSGQLNETKGWPIIINQLTAASSNPHDKTIALNLDYNIHFCDGTYNTDTSVSPNKHFANIVIPEYDRHVSIDIISPKNKTSIYPFIEKPIIKDGFVNENMLIKIPDNASISGTLPAGLRHQLIPGYIAGIPTATGQSSIKLTSGSTVQNIHFVINSTSAPIFEYLTNKTKQIDIKFPINGAKSCASFLMIYCNLKQEFPLKNYYNDLFPVNLNTTFSLPTTGIENLNSWATYDKSRMVNLDDSLDVAASIQNKIVFDNGKGTAISGIAPRKKRILYMAILKRNSNNTDEYNHLNIDTITSGIATTTTQEQYALNVYNDVNFSVYKGTFDDGGVTVKSLSLIHNESLSKKNSYFHLGITTEEYNKLIYGQTTVPLAVPPATAPPQFLPSDADNVYFHLQEVSSPNLSTQNVQKFKVGIRYEDNLGLIVTNFPSSANDVYVYTIDGNYFFSNDYSEFQEFFEEYPQAKADFRINQPYVGEFGFDWMRLGDTTLLNGNPVPGDINYKNLLGKLYRDTAHTIIETNTNTDTGNFKPLPKMFNKLEKEYKSFPIQWNTNKSIEKYYVPLLNIYPPYISNSSSSIDLDRQPIFGPIFDDDINRVANLKLVINVFSVEPTKIELLYDKTILEIKSATSTGAFTIPKAIGNNNLDITVKCLQEFGVEQEVKVIAFYGNSGKGRTIGILRVKPNLKTNRFSKKVLLVDVVTNLTGTIKPLTFSIKQHAENLKMFLRQISITPILDIEKIDLVATPDTFFNSNFVHTNSTGSVIKGYDERTPALDVVNYLYTKLTTQTISGSSNLIGTKYDDYFKIFFFHDKGGYLDSSGNFGSLSGYSYTKDKLVDFPNIYPSTSTHEFLHTAKVPHSFTAYEASQFAKFTYKPWVTDNIMDYSDLHSTNNSNLAVGLPTISIYDWQGNIAQQYSDPEP